MDNGINTSFVKQLSERQITTMNFPNLGVLFGKIEKEIYDELLSEGLRLKKENSEEMDYRKKLVGNLSYEYNMVQKSHLLEPLIQQLMKIYDSEYNFLKDYNVNVSDCHLKIHSLWVNFMNRNDFNPPHNHAGVFSFVIWMKIPYELQKELNVYPSSRSKGASKFYFIYSNILGDQSTFPVDIDNDYEGVICFFPSKLYHFVNPFFTSDESRISIAGNVHFNNI